jgi:hypothetical protein
MVLPLPALRERRPGAAAVGLGNHSLWSRWCTGATAYAVRARQDMVPTDPSLGYEVESKSSTASGFRSVGHQKASPVIVGAPGTLFWTTSDVPELLVEPIHGVEEPFDRVSVVALTLSQLSRFFGAEPWLGELEDAEDGENVRADGLVVAARMATRTANDHPSLAIFSSAAPMRADLSA